MSDLSDKSTNVLRALASTVSQRMTIDELIATVGKGSSKQAMQSTIRILERDGYVLRRYSNLGRVKLIVVLTDRGLKAI